jgi:hypothetical protein
MCVSKALISQRITICLFRAFTKSRTERAFIQGIRPLILELVREKVESGEAVVVPWSALLSGRRADVEG